MSDQEENAPAVRGVVKWFDSTKGFGFIVADTGGDDILLHANVLRNFGQGSVANGAIIEVLVHKTDRGVQALEVLQIERPPGVEQVVLNELGALGREDYSALPMEPARVKWFDRSKGFGFANVFGQPQDVFIHIEVLQFSGLADLEAGEAVCLRIVDGKRGRMAVEVLAWEMGVRS
jgi:cold shock protein